ncbi:hypothetical protein BC831DRAFT_513408 [Entophlyctis helioformis]|nr:hypothetical protein BC831DRAFT_513408 [Entophlyctis helioformis]
MSYYEDSAAYGMYGIPPLSAPAQHNRFSRLDSNESLANMDAVHGRRGSNGFPMQQNGMRLGQSQRPQVSLARSSGPPSPTPPMTAMSASVPTNLAHPRHPIHEGGVSASTPMAKSPFPSQAAKDNSGKSNAVNVKESNPWYHRRFFLGVLLLSFVLIAVGIAASVTLARVRAEQGQNDLKQQQQQQQRDKESHDAHGNVYQTAPAVSETALAPSATWGTRGGRDSQATSARSPATIAASPTGSVPFATVSHLPASLSALVQAASLSITSIAFLAQADTSAGHADANSSRTDAIPSATASIASSVFVGSHAPDLSSSTVAALVSHSPAPHSTTTSLYESESPSTAIQPHVDPSTTTVVETKTPTAPPSTAPPAQQLTTSPSPPFSSPLPPSPSPSPDDTKASTPATANTNTGCTNPAVRREWRELSPSEQRAFTDAVNELKRRPSNAGHANRYEDFVALHMDFADVAHVVPQFLPWHRKFLREFELSLQAIDSSVVVPYFDWALDSQAPARSPIFSASAFGSSGSADPRGCIDSGAFAGWKTNYPSSKCVSRHIRRGQDFMDRWTSPEAMARMILQDGDYDRFRNEFESTSHAQVHTGIAGDMQAMFSPNDPIFWVHHANVDRYWSVWQQSFENAITAYGGFDPVRGVTARLSDNMAPFNVPVSRVMDTRAPGLCYVYSASVRPASARTKRHFRRGPANETTAADTGSSEIILPPPIPEEVARSFGYNLTLIRKVEAANAAFVQEINKNSAYESVAVTVAKNAGKHGGWEPVPFETWRFAPKSERGDIVRYVMQTLESTHGNTKIKTVKTKKVESGNNKTTETMTENTTETDGRTTKWRSSQVVKTTTTFKIKKVLP